MGNDMQFAFAYFQYIMSVKQTTNYKETFEFFDSDTSGKLMQVCLVITRFTLYMDCGFYYIKVEKYSQIYILILPISSINCTWQKFP